MVIDPKHWPKTINSNDERPYKFIFAFLADSRVPHTIKTRIRIGLVVSIKNSNLAEESRRQAERSTDFIYFVSNDKLILDDSENPVFIVRDGCLQIIRYFLK